MGIVPAARRALGPVRARLLEQAASPHQELRRKCIPQGGATLAPSPRRHRRHVLAAHRTLCRSRSRHPRERARVVPCRVLPRGASSDRAAKLSATKGSGRARQDRAVLMLVIQIMEDAWVGARLEQYWSHPLNEGWMNYFQRWASTPSFRRWWPILRPIYSDGFREFVKERFDLRLSEQARGEPASSAMLSLSGADPGALDGLAVVSGGSATASRTPTAAPHSSTICNSTRRTA